MEGSYAVFLGQESVGEITIERQGLYYCFQCRCRLHSAVMCRVMVSCGGHYENLGVLSPDGDVFLLSKKLPVKQFPAGNPEFWITPKRTEDRRICIDIYPEEPFRHIRKLEKAYLETSRGEIKIVINE